MNTFIKLFEVLKKSENTSSDLILFIIACSLALIPIIIKMLKITALNDFDRLFAPQHERSLQQLVVKIKDYIIFTFIYLFVGLYFSLLIKYDFVNSLANSDLLSIFILIVFGITLLIMVFKVIISEWLGKQKFNYNIKYTKYLFLINLYTGIYVFSLLFAILIYSESGLKSEVSFILFLPVILLELYRSFHKRYDYEYMCQTINEEQFNKAMLIFRYSLDNDKMIFAKPGDSSFKEVYLYDKNANLFLRFTKIEIL
jgi:hypothetical protein